MTDNRSVPSPADKLLAMLRDDPDEVERLPLDAVTARLRELGVDPAVPERFREFVGGERDPADHLLARLNGGDLAPADLERLPLPEVVAALGRLGIDHAAGVERVRETLREPPKPEPARGGVVWTRVFSELDWMPWGPFHMRLLFTLAACWASVGLQVALVAMFKGSIVGSLGVGAGTTEVSTEVSWAVALSLLGTAFGALAFGRLADRLGRRSAFSVSIALCALGAALTPFSSGVAMLDVVRIVAGVGTGGCCVAVNATVQELMPARARGRACLAVNASFWLGMVFSALGAVWLSDALGAVPGLDGWKAAFWANAALLSLATLFLLRWVPESPRWLVTQGRTKEAEKVVAEIKRSLPPTATALLPIAGPVPFDTRLGRPTLIEVWGIMRRDHWRALLLCLALMSVQAFFYNVSFFGHVDVLRNLGDADAAQKQLASGSEIGWHLLPVALGNFLGPVLLGRWLVVDGRRGRRRTMAITFLASGALLAVTAVLFGLWGDGGPIGFGSVYFTAAWTVIFLFASAAASTAYLTSGELFPLEIRAQAFAVVYAGSMGVGFLGPLLFGWAAGAGSPAIALVHLSAALLMVAVAVAVAPLQWRRVRLWPSWQVPPRVLPELSGKPAEAAVRPLSRPVEPEDA